jgi:hypothetical protein
MFREHLGLSTEIWIGRVRGSYLVSFICCDFIFIYFCFAKTAPASYKTPVVLLIYIVKSIKSLIGDIGKTKHIA